MGGSILIDNIDIRDLALESLRKNISVVFQDSNVMNRTVRDNLLIGDPNATDQDIYNALEGVLLYELDSYTLSIGLLVSFEILLMYL